VASFVNIGGIGLGPLAGGILAQWVSSPLRTPYVIFVILLALSAIAVAFVPETVERQEERPAYRPQRVSLPQASRRTFYVAGASAISSFALFGIFTSLAPSFIAGTLHETSHFVAGAVVFAVFGSAALTQVLTGRLPGQRQLLLAAALMAAGLIAMSAAVLIASLALFIAAGIAAGAGAGVAFRSAVAVAASLARPSSRGEVLAALFLIAYAGLAVPAVLVGAALTFLSNTGVFIGFSVVVLVLAVGSSLAMAARSR
jgi:MFS family permease